jgi:hypothetical protein
VDLFAVGKDGAVYTTFYDDNGGWHNHWFRLGDQNFPDGFTLAEDTPIGVVSRMPSQLDLFAVGKDGAVYTTFYGDFPGQPTMTGDVATYDSGLLTTTDSLPLDGSVNLVLKKNGDFTFNSHAHDSGFDNINYTVSAVVMTPDAIAITFQHQGTVHGTDDIFNENRNDNFTQGGNLNTVSNEWPGIPGSILVASVSGTLVIPQDLENALSGLVQAALSQLGQAAAKAIVAAVSS